MPPSDGFDDRIPADAPSEPEAEVTGIDVPEAAPVSGGEAERSRRRRLALLALLLLLLAFVTYVTYYYAQNKRLPIPQVVTNPQNTLAAPQFLYAFSGTGRQAMTRPTGIAIIGDRVYVTDFAAPLHHGVHAGPAPTSPSSARSSDGCGDASQQPRPHRGGPGQVAVGHGPAAEGHLRLQPGGRVPAQVRPQRRLRPSSGRRSASRSRADGTVYVTDVGDSENHRVMVFAPDGALKASWGTTKQSRARRRVSRAASCSPTASP